MNYFVVPVSFSSPDPTPGLPLNLPQIRNLGDATVLDNNLIVLNLASMPTPVMIFIKETIPYNKKIKKLKI
jgi:hypothetical protein